MQNNYIAGRPLGDWQWRVVLGPVLETRKRKKEEGALGDLLALVKVKKPKSDPGLPKVEVHSRPNICQVPPQSHNEQVRIPKIFIGNLRANRKQLQKHLHHL